MTNFVMYSTQEKNEDSNLDQILSIKRKLNKPLSSS